MLEGAKEFPLLQISIVPGVTYIVGSRDAIASKKNTIYYLGVLLLHESSLPDHIRQVLGGQEPGVEVVVENLEPIVFLAPEIITEIHRHLFRNYLILMICNLTVYSSVLRVLA